MDLLNTCENLSIYANLAIDSQTLEIISEFSKDCTSFMRVLKEGGLNFTHYSIMIDHEKANLDNETLRGFCDELSNDISIYYEQGTAFSEREKTVVRFTGVKNDLWISFEMSAFRHVYLKFMVPIKVFARPIPSETLLDFKFLCKNYHISADLNADQCSNILTQLVTDFKTDCTVLLKLLSVPRRILSLRENFVQIYTDDSDSILQLRIWNKVLSLCDVDEFGDIQFCEWRTILTKRVIVGNISKLDTSSFLVWIQVRDENLNLFSFPIRVWPKRFEKSNWEEDDCTKLA